MRILPLLLLAALLGACEKAPAPPPPPPLVLTLVAGESADGRVRTYSGEVHARHELPLSFRIGGKLVERKVDAGARVRPGQVLARLDTADVALQAGQAEAQRLLAEADARRYRDLYGKKFVSAAALDAKETALKAATAQAGVARNQAAYADLRADGAGVVAAVLAEPGQVLTSGQAVLRLALDGEREVSIDLPETEVAAFHPGDEAQVTLWSSGKVYRGRLREISPAADPATRTYGARVQLPEADDAVVLGMTADVRFAAGKDQAIVLPRTAIYQQDKGSGPAVWVVGKDETLSLRPVSLGAYTDAGAVVTGGIVAGERIVAAGVHKLAAGIKVRVAVEGR